MKELTPYERFLADNLRHLPVPNEDRAWEEMKKLLEEKDDDKPLVPVWLKGCLPWAIGLILLVGGGLIWYNLKENQVAEIDKSPRIQAATRNKDSVIRLGPAVSTSENYNLSDSQNRTSIIISDDSVLGRREIPGTYSHQRASANLPEGKIVPKTGNVAEGTSSAMPKPGGMLAQGPYKDKAISNRRIATQGRAKASVKRPVVQSEVEGGDDNNVKKAPKTNDDIARSNASIHSQKIENRDEESDENAVPDADGVNEEEHADSTTSVVHSDADSIVQPTDTTSAVKDSSNNKKDKTPFTFATGLAVNQLIPINGEKRVPFDFMGRKGSLSDYIPSVYFRAMKKRWFIQGEFRYGAPNNVKEFVYSRKASIDTFQNSIVTTKTLKKTFYHQLPLTFHYFVTKNWSIGAGVAYNKFTRAVRQEDVRLQIAGSTVDSLLSSNLVQNGRDTAFVTNSFQWIAETQYRWRRFSLGLRYARGLQPYIKYTDPETGLPAEKMNQSLNAFLRFDLWRSKKK